MITSQFQIGKLTIWLEDGSPRCLGMSLEEAQAHLHTCIKQCEQWLDAVEHEKAVLKKEQLTLEELLNLEKWLKKNRSKLLAKDLSIAAEVEKMAQLIRDLRQCDF